MKKVFMLLSICVACNTAMAQEKTAGAIEQKNIVKINLFALALKNIAGQYERAVSKKIAVAATVRFMPKGSLPFKSIIKNAVNNPETKKQIDNINVGNFAFIPEVRFYLGRKGVFNGFYIAPFAGVTRYTADLPYNYDDGGVTKFIPLAGGVTTFTGGFLLGAQWKLGKQVYLDWWILGPNYGKSNGKVSGQKTLTPFEQQSLRDELSKLNIPLTKITYAVDGNGATINFNGPWAGVRSGLCVGFRF